MGHVIDETIFGESLHGHDCAGLKTEVLTNLTEPFQHHDDLKTNSGIVMIRRIGHMTRIPGRQTVQLNNNPIMEHVSMYVISDNDLM